MLRRRPGLRLQKEAKEAAVTEIYVFIQIHTRSPTCHPWAGDEAVSWPLTTWDPKIPFDDARPMTEDGQPLGRLRHLTIYVLHLRRHQRHLVAR